MPLAFAAYQPYRMFLWILNLYAKWYKIYAKLLIKSSFIALEEVVCGESKSLVEEASSTVIYFSAVCLCLCAVVAYDGNLCLSLSKYKRPNHQQICVYTYKNLYALRLSLDRSFCCQNSISINYYELPRNWLLG